MTDYNFFADLLGTYRAMPDTIKALWLLMPPLFIIAVILILRMSRPQRPPKEMNTPHYVLHRTKSATIVAIPAFGDEEMRRLTGAETEVKIIKSDRQE